MIIWQKCKESKKRATYTIQNFGKQDLYSNNSLLNFADDLNAFLYTFVYVSKSPTFNIIC